MAHIYKHKRKSHIEIGEVFFWTATINQWQKLLGEDIYMDVIIDSLEYLSNVGKIYVFAFVIMPNPRLTSLSHSLNGARSDGQDIHLLRRTRELTRSLSGGKETAQGSFLKYTAHEFRKMLLKEGGEKLLSYKVGAES